MKSLEESVISALDGTDAEIYAHLPYILQDLWEIGTSPEIVIELVKKHSTNYHNLKILDLGCGKGAVSIKLADSLGCNCYGIDAIQEFINYARFKAEELKVDSLCKFETGDIRILVNELSGFDVIILGAIGPVLGDYFTTLNKLSGCMNENAVIIIDDGYIEDGSKFTHPLIFKKTDIKQQIEKTDMRLIDSVIVDPDKLSAADDHAYNCIKNRCKELIAKYPHNTCLFENYLNKQAEENNVLENKITCSVMVIKKIGQHERNNKTP